MSREKMIVIGDYEKVEDLNLMYRLVDQFSTNYDVIISGYSIRKINKKNIPEEVVITTLGSKKLLYFKYIASYVWILTPAVNYRKLKDNQKIVYALEDIRRNSFQGDFSAIDYVMTSSSEVHSFFKMNCPQLEMIKFSCTGEKDYIEKIIENAPIPSASQNFLVTVFISAEKNPDYPVDGTVSKEFFEINQKDPGKSVIAISDNLDGESFTSLIRFSAVHNMVSFLSHYNGVVFYDTFTSLGAFYCYLEEHDIQTKYSCEMPIENVNLLYLKTLYDDRESNQVFCETSQVNYHREYKRLLDLAYISNQCEDTKISVIICRYNTPTDLLYRAIDSAMNSGHDNLEILLIDDGSEINIEQDIRDHYTSDIVKYYYKDNEGLGLSRNYAINKATGEYIYYLDSDDEIHRNGLRYLIAQAKTFDADMVAGKRLLCDENKRPISESINNLAGETFRAYGCEHPSNVYIDVMINNKLIRLSCLREKGIVFSKGLYEDIEYSAMLYSKLANYHFVDLFVHDWYQYGLNSTISSSVSINNFRERLDKEIKRWNLIPESKKRFCASSSLISHFKNYFRNYNKYTKEEQLEIWDKLRGFIQGISSYFDFKTPNAKKYTSILNAILNNDFKMFKLIINQYFSINRDSLESYDNYVVLTHYHLIVACLYALKNSDRKSILYLGTSFVKFSNKVVMKIKETNLFEDVITMKNSFNFDKLFEDIDNRPDEKDIVLANTFFPYYQDVFRQSNPANDRLYFFNDALPYWYYVERQFSDLIKLEDAYSSIDREIHSFELSGKWSRILELEGQFFPKMFCRSPKIKEIVISNPIEDIPDYCRDKIIINDTKKLMKQYGKELREIVEEIYEMDTAVFTEDSVLLLTQPLYAVGYCSKKEQKKLYSKICSNIDKNNLLIKPHPGDNLNYDYLGGTVLKKSVPIEVYNSLNVKIRKTISFGSSASETIGFCDNNEILFKLHGFTKDEVIEAINNIVKSPKKKKSFKKRLKRWIKRHI